ncbi:hypothetical protein C7I84_27630 [Mesorhizobium ephedrae]|uniref:Uncharacterized protein n=1 Tax=Kumtagia ephedrae TaxID=2116701 RepID=A0A2P7RMD6_9HYPH|nr:hypothetical protein C7I84_27630 [Mesorhizobium ephedrae]
MVRPPVPSRGKRRPPPDEEDATPPAFPTASTFLLIAVALIALWLLSGGLQHLLGWPDTHRTYEAGASR